MTLENLYQTIVARQTELPEVSYVASLFKGDDDRIIQKIGEEATEVVIAAKNSSKERLISEMADLVFHMLVLLVARGISLEEVIKELERREKNNTIQSSR